MTPAERAQVRVIQTRYRDVDFEVIQPCVMPHTPEKIERARRFWPMLRGTEIRIQTPPIEKPESPCTEPKYQCGGGFVCPHMAEIGD